MKWIAIQQQTRYGMVHFQFSTQMSSTLNSLHVCQLETLAETVKMKPKLAAIVNPIVLFKSSEDLESG